MEVDVGFSKEEYWQNFNLGVELDISGTFIYNGLEYFDKINKFSLTSDLFQVFYNLSVGIERLMKVAIILTEYNSNVNIEKFEKSLITHNLMVLSKRIRQENNFLLESIHNEFIQLLTEFYKSLRYNRFNITSIYSIDSEKNKFINFISKNLKDSTIEEDLNNNNRIKKFIGKVVHKIISQLYEIVNVRARQKNIYTYELKYDSKAAYIFWNQELNFIKDNIYKKEILLHLVAHLPKDLIYSIKPLQLKHYNIETYINSLFHFRDYSNVWSEIETIYVDDLKVKYKTNIKERLELIENIETFFDNEIEE